MCTEPQSIYAALIRLTADDLRRAKKEVGMTDTALGASPNMQPSPQTSGQVVDVTAIIVNYNTKALLSPCIDALRVSAAGLRLQIVIVDNASSDGSVPIIKANYADCDLVFNETNVGFGRANNQALPMARGRYLLLLNTDAFVAEESLSRTLQFLEARPSCALLGVRLVGRDGSLQPSCRYFPTPWNEFLNQTGFGRFFPGTQPVDNMAWDHASPRDCDWVPGCYYLVRTSVVEQVGLFDPRYFLYNEEVDHCRAVKAAGWQVMYCPDTTVVHIGGESAKFDAQITEGGRQNSLLQTESSLLYYRKHYGLAGLWASVLLSTLADTLQALKALIRGGSLSAAASCWQHTAMTWSSLRKTGLGLRPTR